jgi:hypothetical protein
MKNLKRILLILLVIPGLSLIASDTLYYRFNNFYVKPASPKDTMIFEVEIRSSTANTYLIGFQLDIIFNSTVFGIDAQPVSVQRLALIANKSAYDFEAPMANPATNKFRYALTQFFPPYDPAQLALVPTSTWGKLMRFKMPVENNSENAGIQFDIGPMGGNQYFCLVSGYTRYKYAPIVASNDILNMPSTPTIFNLLISEVGAPLTPYNNARFVEIYNPSTSAVSFNIFPWYITQETNGTSRASVKLTGSIPAGGTFVIAHDLTDFSNAGFTANQYSTVIDNGGGETYVLSTYGEYAQGTNIDIYGQIGSTGSGMPWYFANSHAVRHFVNVNPGMTWVPSQWVISPAENIDLTPGSHRSTLTWNGSQSSNWRQRNNWTPDFVPDVGHDVTIPANISLTPSMNDNAWCHHLSIGN